MGDKGWKDPSGESASLPPSLSLSLPPPVRSRKKATTKTDSLFEPAAPPHCLFLSRSRARALALSLGCLVADKQLAELLLGDTLETQSFIDFDELATSGRTVVFERVVVVDRCTSSPAPPSSPLSDVLN